MKSYYIIIRDDLNNGEEVNRSDFFDNAEDAIQWGKDEVRDVQGWFWVLEEQTRVKCENCGKELLAVLNRIANALEYVHITLAHFDSYHSGGYEY